MSLRIIKAGLFDTIQDRGRYGYQYLGINPGGCMDLYAAQLANAILGKRVDTAVIEMHFPAATILFEKETVICITGADMVPTINDNAISLNQPVRINKNDVLSFGGLRAGARCYLAIVHDLSIEKWLESWSTNVYAGVGGFQGRQLKRDDVIEFDKVSVEISDFFQQSDIGESPTKHQLISDFFQKSDIYTESLHFIIGPEYSWLEENSQNALKQNTYLITKNSNRMGYRLFGEPLKRNNTEEELISSPVTFGTVQLLPDGQLIILMADHQTTGGYPRIGTVISADLPILAQKKPGDTIRFTETDIFNAEKLYIEKHAGF